MFLNNRYHDPTTAQFISVDPLVQTTGEPYIYGAANPITLSDPSGLCPYTGCWEAFDAWLRGYTTAANYVQGDGEEAPGEHLPRGRRVGHAERLADWSYQTQGKRDSHMREPALYGEFPNVGGFTLGVDWDFCVFLCTPDFGISSRGPYIRLGVGVGLESPGLEIRAEAPECGSRVTTAEAAVGVGVKGTSFDAGLGIEASRPLGSTSWTITPSIGVGRSVDRGVSFGDSGAGLSSGGPRYRGYDASAVLAHEVTLC